MNAQDLLALAEDIAREAGGLLRARPARLQVDAKSTQTDWVTEMDRASERLIVERIRAVRPGDRIVGEESGADAQPAAATAEGAGATWFVDPLDGTVNYVYAIPQFCVSIGVQVDDVTVAGAVYDVMKDEMYAATRGGGATRNGMAIHCSTQTDPALALVATGFAYDSAKRAEQARLLPTVLPAVRDIRRLGAAALDLCAVASGLVDGYYEAGMHPWDWTAGALIATEAGARVGGLGGRPPGPWTTLAANPTLFAELERLLVAAGDSPDMS